MLVIMRFSKAVPMTRLFILLASVLMLQACISVRTNHGYVLERDQDTLTAEAGFDTKESVLAKYGEPSIIGTFDNNVWYYLNSSDSSRAFLLPKTQRRVVVAFRFDDGGTVSTVENFDITDGESISMVSRITPTRGKELNFWEQLLGNVGQLPAGLGQQGQVPGQ